ncbi:Hypothetical predicted protein [Paramuricea clavata]|uniref:Uncharacterized protein n=1 Tax=Paramuricea clavata TaxID=317549 RepID=A0A7D9HXR1_PARCT|nr:Hypothetical predicted protein [Paramuricea clavata]
MLEEIAGMFLSLFSLFWSDRPRVSFREQIDSEEGGVDDDRWQPYINEEYENFHTNKRLSSVLVNGRLTDYTRLDGTSSGRRTYWESIRRSLWTTLRITFAIFIPTTLTLAFLFIDLNTTDLCLEWQYHNNTLPFSVKRLRLIGDSVEAVITNLWFPLTMVVLFGWKEFKLRFLSTFYVAFIFGETTVIYYLFLLVFGVYGTSVYYRYSANALFFIGIICCCILVLRNIRANRSRNHTLSYSKFHILALVSAEFMACSVLAVTYRYAIVPFFNSVKQEIYKFLVAVMVPGLTIIPAAICKHIALRRSSEVVHPGRSFVLVYIIRVYSILLYRTMQADLKNIRLFIGLSLFSGFLNFLEKATHRIRMKLWTYIISLLNRTACCQGLNELPQDTPHYRRLKADLEIQDMLFEYSTLVLSQGYFVLYFVESFQLSVSSFCLESLKRVAIGMGIDFFFNCLSNFVQIHYYNIPVGRVWTKYWKRHRLANFIIVIVIVSYFSPVLASVFQARETGTSNTQYIVRNCTFF